MYNIRPLSLLAALPLLLPATLAIGQKGFALGSVIGTATTCKTQQDWEADFDAIKADSGSTIVRIYAAGQCDTAKNILPAAKNKGFKVILGVWPDTDDSLQVDKAAVVEYVPQYPDQVYAVTIGSETLYRKTFDGPTLLTKINDVKSALPTGTRVGTADSWNKFADGTADAVISGGVDIILANGFSYWQGSTIANSSHVYFDDMMQALSHVQAVSGSLTNIEFWNGETGWPTDGGSDFDQATASTKNAAQFYSQGFCGMLNWGINAFYFEAFDEPWKANATGDNGVTQIESVWGAWDVNRKAKFNLEC